MAKDDFMERASRHHTIPAVGRAREKAKMVLGGGKVHGGQTRGLSEEGAGHGGHSPEHEAATAEHVRLHGPVVHTQVGKHHDGTAHVIAHHANGHAEIHQHPHSNSAESHAHHMMAGGGGAGAEHGFDHAGAHPAIQNALEEEPEGTPQEAEMEGEGECPECGAKMEGDRCPQCGYEAKSAEHTGEEEPAEAEA